MTTLRRRVLALAMAAAASLALPPAAPAPLAAQARAPGGSLSQSEVAVRLEAGQVEMRFLPLEEELLALLAPDAGSSLRAMLGSRRAAIDSLAREAGVASPGLALVSFRGLHEGARFAPDLVFVTARGRVHRPIGILPLTASFAAEQLPVRATASALYLFEAPLPVTEPMTVEYEGVRSDEWRDKLPVLQRERARTMSRGR